jgi:hypothetical protein
MAFHHTICPIRPDSPTQKPNQASSSEQGEGKALLFALGFLSPSLSKGLVGLDLDQLRTHWSRFLVDAKVVAAFLPTPHSR